GYADFRKLLDDPAVHAVVVSTPDHWHALTTMLACAAGKDVYVEKPLTLFVREGRWVVDVARRHKSVVQVGTQQRSGPHYQRARELLRQGRLGKVVSVRMGSFRNVMPGFGKPPDGDPPAGLEFSGPKGSLTISRSGFLLAGDRKVPPENAVPQFGGAHPVGGPKRVEQPGADETWTGSVEDRSGNAREQLRLHVRNFLDCV